MYSQLPVGVIFAQMTTEKLLKIFQDGIESENVLQALSVMEVLIERRSASNVEKVILDNLENDRLTPLSTFGIAMSNALVESSTSSLRTLGRIMAQMESDSGRAVIMAFASEDALQSDR